MDRDKQTFPTRQFPYQKDSGIANEIKERHKQVVSFSSVTGNGDGIKHFRFILGVDEFPKPVTEDDWKLMRDSFAQLVLAKKEYPLTLTTLLQAIDKSNGTADGLPNQTSFLVADGGQINWSEATKNLKRQFRFVIHRSNQKNDLILISASTVLTSEEQFIQLISWDSVNHAYNFYERREGAWFWAGNSYDALRAPSRGKGPFDSHVNGALVMKELKAPWVHWHSMKASINDDILAPGDVLRNEKLWTNKRGAQEFELSVARPGVIRWNKARIDKSIDGNEFINECNLIFTQFLETSTINLASTDNESKSVTNDSSIRIPETLFFNKDLLMDILGLEPPIAPIMVKGDYYLQSLTDFNFSIADSEFSFKGDTHFAFIVPEPAFEDNNLISMLFERNIISAKFISALTMVDFTNPIYSEARKSLAKYIPVKASIKNFDLEQQFLKGVRNAPDAGTEGSAEFDFIANYALPDDKWKSEFENRIKIFFLNLKKLVEIKEGFYELVKLTESRRREFRKKPLAEFRLTTPTTNIPEGSPFLKIDIHAKLQTK